MPSCSLFFQAIKQSLDRIENYFFVKKRGISYVSKSLSRTSPTEMHLLAERAAQTHAGTAFDLGVIDDHGRTAERDVNVQFAEGY